MFFSSAGLAVDFHYCQGKLKTFGLFQKAKTCHEVAANASHCHKAKKKTCHKQLNETTCKKDGDQKGCCDNEMAFILLDADYGVAEYISFDVHEIQFVAAFIASFYHVFQEVDSSISHYQNYKPPLLDRDSVVLIQSFLC